jgi:hypothetical protein
VPPDVVSFGVPPPPTASVEERFRWCEARLSGTPSAMLDYLYLSPYDPAMGFKVRVDGVHNLPAKTNSVVKVIQSVYPPGALYHVPPDPSVAQFSQSHEWEKSTVRSQRFRDGYAVYSDVPYSSNLCVLLDVRLVTTRRSTTASGGTAVTVESVGWGVLPVIDQRSEGYVNRGAYLVPLFEGTPPKVRRVWVGGWVVWCGVV